MNFHPHTSLLPCHCCRSRSNCLRAPLPVVRFCCAPACAPLPPFSTLCIHHTPSESLAPLQPWSFACCHAGLIMSNSCSRLPGRSKGGMRWKAGCSRPIRTPTGLNLSQNAANSNSATQTAFPHHRRQSSITRMGKKRDAAGGSRTVQEVQSKLQEQASCCGGSGALGAGEGGGSPEQPPTTATTASRWVSHSGIVRWAEEASEGGRAARWRAGSPWTAASSAAATGSNFKSRPAAAIPFQLV